MSWYVDLCLFVWLIFIADVKDPRDLSEEPHFDDLDHEHNPEYDHEAFLGKDEASEFEKLPPEEAKRRLG